MSYDQRERAARSSGAGTYGGPTAAAAAASEQQGAQWQRQQQQQAGTKKTEKELLLSTQRSLMQADEMSTVTLSTLHQQTEQLNRIKEDNAAISNNLDQSEFLIRGLGSRWGMIKNIFRRKPQDQGKKLLDDRGQASSAGGYPSATDSGKGAGKGYPASSSSAPTASSGSSAAARLRADDARRRGVSTGEGASAEKAETDKIYDQIDNVLDGLKVKSQEMSRTLDQHNRMLPDISDSVDTNKERIAKQSRDMRKILGK